MSIQSEITRIQNNVKNSLDVVAAYGVNVPANATSDDLPSLIAKIADKVINKENLSLGIASDDLIYIFVDGTPIGMGIPFRTAKIIPTRENTNTDAPTSG